jgi:methyl-accepting chemotaxis protein
MVKFINSLQTKLIVSFILLILVVAGGTFSYTYNETKKALLDSTRDDLLQIIGMASTQFSAQEVEAMCQLQEGQDDSSEFLALKGKMQEMRSLSPNVVNLYTMRREGDTWIFLVDDAADEPAKIGQVYQEPEPELFEAVNGPRVSDNIYTDEFGTFLSAYAPLKDSAVQSTVIVGADIEAKQVIHREHFIGNTIYVIMGIAVILAGVIIGIFSMTIIRDIRKLNKTATEISTGNMNVSVDVKRKDEIGELADSFSRMVASLKFMMSDREEK